MSFTSLSFYLFLPIVFACYWLISHPSAGCPLRKRQLWVQNLFVVMASYVFYGWWDWRFLILITITAVWSWVCGICLSRLSDLRRRRQIVAAALVVNLAILGVFKYYNFFADSAASVLGMFGLTVQVSSLRIILPVGISFYTFQALSYVIDVYRKDIEPTKDIVAFLAFVSFFPQLVAGPIERARNLLPQFTRARVFDYSLAVDGCRQMLWGFFKKMVIADGCAFAANEMLGKSNPSSVSIWVGIFFFAFQIYGDFSGYSDIAIGCSKLFGIRLMRNFNVPYFSRDIAEFWRRWHISLTTWFRDYLYIPLGGSRCSTGRKIRNTFVVFLVSGLWHGANWTYVAWGCFHALCFLPLLLSGKNRKYVGGVVAQDRKTPTILDLSKMALTFILVLFGWTFFRAPDVLTAFGWLWRMVSFSDVRVSGVGLGLALWPLALVVVLVCAEWFNRKMAYGFARYPRRFALRWVVYLGILFATAFGLSPRETFIYFQF